MRALAPGASPPKSFNVDLTSQLIELPVTRSSQFHVTNISVTRNNGPHVAEVARVVRERPGQTRQEVPLLGGGTAHPEYDNEGGEREPLGRRSGSSRFCRWFL